MANYPTNCFSLPSSSTQSSGALVTSCYQLLQKKSCKSDIIFKAVLGAQHDEISQLVEHLVSPTDDIVDDLVKILAAQSTTTFPESVNAVESLSIAEKEMANAPAIKSSAAPINSEIEFLAPS